VGVFGDDDTEAHDIVKLLVKIRDAQGRPEDAQRWRDRLPEE